MLSEVSVCVVFFFLMIRRPPRSTLDRSSAASDVYKRQVLGPRTNEPVVRVLFQHVRGPAADAAGGEDRGIPVSYTHLRAHETVLDLVCRLLLEKKKTYIHPDYSTDTT